METNAATERRDFVRDFGSGQWSMTELCERYRISRPTGYKWVARYESEGEPGLDERSRVAHACPHRTQAVVEMLLVAARRQYGWGAQKLVRVLAARYPHLAWPARSTVNSILGRYHLLRKNRRRRGWAHPRAPVLQTTGPNQVWPADFKGQFKTGDAGIAFH